MPKTPLTIGQQIFPTRTEAGDHFRELKDSYPRSQPVPVADHALWNDLLPRHPRFVDFSADGIEYFMVRENRRCQNDRDDRHKFLM